MCVVLYPHGKLATTAMWSVSCIAGLIFLLNVSAGLHLGGKNDRLRLDKVKDRVQFKIQETEPDFNHLHHIQETDKAGWVIFAEHVMYNCKE